MRDLFGSSETTPRLQMPQVGDAPGRYVSRGNECCGAALRFAERGDGRLRYGRDRSRSPEALRSGDRRREAVDSCRGARARTAEGRGRRDRQAEADRVEPPARDVDHAQLHACRRPAARPHPGGQPRPHARRREVRLDDGVQAVHLRDVVDPAGGAAGARRAEPHDPAAGSRRGPGPPRAAGTANTRPAAESRPVRRRDRDRDRAHAPSGCRSSSTSSRTT